MTKMIRGLTLLGLSALTLTALSGCETGEDRSLASAQSCLDNAHNESDANQCIALVEGLTTPDSYLIRCSANFIAQGFTGQKIADAFQTLANNGSSTVDPMVGLMAYLNFVGTNPLHSAANTELNCQRSGVRSMLRLASAANLATTVQNLVPGIPFNPADPVASMEAAINYLKDHDPVDEDAEKLGQIAITANEAFCNAGSAYANEDICIQLGNSISAGQNGTDIAAIGLELINLLKTAP